MKKFLSNPLAIIGIIFAPFGLIFSVAGLITAIFMDSIKRNQMGHGNPEVVPVVFITIGVVFLVIGVTMLVFAVKKNRMVQKVMNDGFYIEAVITKVYENLNVTINGRHPYKLDCRYTDPVSGKVHLFTSGNMGYCPSDIVGCEIRVYVDADNYNKYHVYTEVIEDMVEKH